MLASEHDGLEIPGFLRRPFQPKESEVSEVIEGTATEIASSALPAKTSGAVGMTPMAMVELAVSKGDVGMVAQLMELQERWEKNQGRKEFDEAIAAAKAEIPPIFKNRTVDFTSQKGRTNYKHEDLGEIARTIDPILSKFGLSYRFRTKTEAEAVHVTCILSHRAGHSEENTLSAGHDNSGNKNSIQAIGSTVTYLERYTLKAALGLAASADDDGRASGNGKAISDEQCAEIQRRVVATGSDINKFCKVMGVECLPDLPARQYDEAIRKLKLKADQVAQNAGGKQ